MRHVWTSLVASHGGTGTIIKGIGRRYYWLSPTKGTGMWLKELELQATCGATADGLV